MPKQLHSSPSVSVDFDSLIGANYKTFPARALRQSEGLTFSLRWPNYLHKTKYSNPHRKFSINFKGNMHLLHDHY